MIGNMVINWRKMMEEGTTLHSSGTTGAPKPIYQPPAKLAAANSIAREVQNINSKSRVMTVCKLDHAGGLLAQTLPALEVGAHVDIFDFNPYKFVSNYHTYTHTHLTPNHLRLLRKTKTWGSLDLSNLHITCGSDRVANWMIQDCINQGATFTVNWGMSEIGPCAINKTFRFGEEIPHMLDHSLMGDTVFCDVQIKANVLFVKGDICVYDDWFKTGDIVNERDGVYFYEGRVNSEKKR